MRYLQLAAGAVDLSSRMVTRLDGGEAVLTEIEAKLLRHLVARAGQPVARTELLREVWGLRGAVVTRCVDSAVRRLRVKIEADPSAPQHLCTVHGAGYRLDLAGAPVRVAVSGTFYGRRAELAWLRRTIAQEPAQITVVGLPGSGRSRLIEETRRALGVPDGVALVAAEAPSGEADERLLVLGPLAAEAAVALLRDRAPGPHDDWEALAAAADGMPAVLLELAERARLLGPAALLVRLEADPLRLLPRSAARTQQRWAALSPALQGAVTRLAISARRALPTTDAEAMLGADGLSQLEALAVCGLLIREVGAEGAVLLRLPLLLRAVARGAADADDWSRLAAWLLTRLEALLPAYHQEGGSDAVAAGLELLPEVAALLPRALRTPELAAQLVVAIDTPLLRRGLLEEAAALQGALAGSEGRLSPLRRSQLEQIRSERLRRTRQVPAAAAAADAALAAARRAADPEALGMALGQQALVAHTRHDYTSAEAGYRAAMAAMPDSAARMRGAWQGALGALLSQLGRAEEAEALLRSLIDNWQGPEDLRRAARVRGQLARMLIERGMLGQAEQQLSESLALSSRLGDQSALALDYLRLGLLHADRREWGAALRAFQQSEAAADQGGVRYTFSQAIGYQGVTCLLAGQEAEAERLLRRCIELHRGAGQPDRALSALGWLVALEAGQGRVAEARESDAALSKLRQSGPTFIALQRAHIGLSASSPRDRAAAWSAAKTLLHDSAAAAAAQVELRLARRHLAARVQHD